MGKIIKKCNICDSSTIFVFENKILNKYNIKYYKCNSCSLLQTEDPFWLQEAYSNPLTVSYDTGYLFRNIYLSKIISRLLYYLFDKNGKYVDFGGGYGVFTRLMRDLGFDFYWKDEYSTNIFSPGFEIDNHLNINITGVTAFEVAEHLKNFNDLFDYVFRICNAKLLIFSTRLYGNSIPPKSWSYYSFEAGAHISFYNKNTFNWIAAKNNMYFYTNNSSLHIFSTTRINKLFLSFFWSKLGSYLPISIKSKHIEDSQFLKTKLKEIKFYGI